jgi:uncharacterized protein YcbK (DUF882 family)
MHAFIITAYETCLYNDWFEPITVPTFKANWNRTRKPPMKPLLKPLLLLICMAAVGSLSGNTGGERSLKFFHTHTEESLQVVYFRQGEYDPKALADIRVFLADWRDGKQHDLDPQLMDILWQIQQATGLSDTWEVISAYRSPETNEMLRSRSSGVAKKSQHLAGNAIDVRLRGLDLEVLRDTAKTLKLGGVGYYAGSNFVHVDTGRVRYW